MSIKPEENPGIRKLMLGARALSLFYICAQFWLYLEKLSDLAFLAAGFAIVTALGIMLARSKLRLIVALVASALLPFAIRLLSMVVLGLNSAIFPGPEADSLVLDFDASFVPFSIPFVWAGVSAILSARHQKFNLVECGINALLVALAFWSQADYKTSLYEYPSLFALSVGIFIIIEATRLFAYSRLSSGVKSNPLPLLLALLPVIAAMLFLILGKYSEGATAQGGGLLKPTLALDKFDPSFDFSQYLKLENDISTSDQLIMFAKKEGPDSAYLARRYVLSGYSKEQGFYVETAPDTRDPSFQLPSHNTDFPDPLYEGRLVSEQEYYIVNFDTEALIAMNYPLSMTRLIPQPGSLFSSAFAVTSMVPDYQDPGLYSAIAPKGEAGSEMSAEALEFYTRYGDDSEIRYLAQKVTKGYSSYVEKAVAIESYFRDKVNRFGESFRYSLKPGIAPDGNQLRYFLFVSRKGYCAYFAYAMTLMLRSVGIPARVAAGFILDSQDLRLGYYEVHSNKAHAWVEVFFPGYGWLEFDPTTKNLADGEFGGFGEGQLPPDSSKYLKELLERNFAEDSSKAEDESDKDEESGFKGLSPWLIAIPFAIYLFLALLSFLAPLIRASLSRDPRRRVLALYEALTRQAARGGLGALPGETMLEEARRLDRDSRARLCPACEIAECARFAPEFNEAEAIAFIESYALARASLRKSIGIMRSLVGFIDPRQFFRRARWN